MKSIIYFLTLSTCAFTSLHTADIQSQVVPDEIVRIDQLIQATEASLTRLKSLKTLLVDYKKAEVQAVNNPKDTDNLLKLVTLASQIQTTITDSALQDYFAPQFLEELKKFAQISEKKNIPQAK